MLNSLRVSWCLFPLLLVAAVANAREERSFRPVTVSHAEVRLDVHGKPIDCHDGCLEYFAGRYYLYGTRYGETDGFTPANRYVVYSSPDLERWELHGDLLADTPEGVYYRPYVKHNPTTGKYVLWYNWYPVLWEGQYGVATSDTPQGPFKIHNDNVRMAQPRPGDHGLFADDDGTAYLIYTSIELGHSISIEKLTPDWLSSTEENSGVFASGCEAASMFKRGDRYYALFGPNCCFCPEGSGARVFVANNPLGPYQEIGDINRDETGRVTIPAQQTHIARLPGSKGDQYLWMGDLWGSRADGVKGHDLQHWSEPLVFSPDGSIAKLKRSGSVEVEVVTNRTD
ncbi:family 43 glycosylhydrolase [Botrimarina hoheduenensis]|uniref:Glycosyl hydrolases family 43 n=1 Tax=Botrimarina hoheduenensis TaxID=2528000 RepID=A0A5C5W9Z2_9BACT|nr:family 43 glycosylhydrolase [Botrimarina hoheduenensis]TWT47470.1 Glycosyl hydrolases family 43 [Botrimarina hoheduenensis]